MVAKAVTDSTGKTKTIEEFAPANVQLTQPGGLARRVQNATAAYALTGSGLAALGNFIFPYGLNYDGRGGVFGSLAGAIGSFLSIAPRDFDYSQVNPLNSSIVMACLGWICRTFREAKPEVYKPGEDETPVVVPNHPLTRLLRRPNPYYSYSKLMAGVLIDYNINGNAYVFKEKGDNGAGQTKRLYFIPSWQITPQRIRGSNNLVDYYLYMVDGRRYAILPDRIIHFRYDLDITNPMLGRKPLAPVFSEIFGDEQAARYTAALLRNMAIPGVAITPEDDNTDIDEEAADEIKEDFKRKFGGDNVGEPWVANFREAVSLGVEGNLVPTWEDFGDDFTQALLPEFEKDPDAFVAYNLKNVKALQENADSLFRRFVSIWTTDVVTRAEIRGALGFKVDESRDGIFYSDVKRSIAAAQAAANPLLNGAAGNAPPSKGLRQKATPRKNRDKGFSYMLEAEVGEAIRQMEEDLKAFYEDMGETAENLAEDSLDLEKPEAEGKRIGDEVFNAGVEGLIAIFGLTGESSRDGAIRAVSLTLGIEAGDAWNASAAKRFNRGVETRRTDYAKELRGQVQEAVTEAIKLAKGGVPAEEIAARIRGMVEGRNLYPGKFQEAFDAAKARGADDARAHAAGEEAARDYRAKVVAETEARTIQNLGVLESLQTAGIERVKVEDGDGCGWKSHEDEDKAHNTIRKLSEAKEYSLAHPNCKRRFYPIEDEGAEG